MLTGLIDSLKGATMKDATSVKQRTRLLELMNSRGTGVTGGVDLLDNGAAAVKILRLFTPRTGHSDLIDKVSPEIREIRSALTEIVANPGSRTAWATLNRLSERVQFSARLQPGKRSELEPKPGNVLVASILKDVIEVMDRGEWERFKQCARETCSSTFFDASRSKTQRWCPYDNCGNVMNVAAHRARTR
jgi:predicted RNA-binding Zn ribbon-like protein